MTKKFGESYATRIIREFKNYLDFNNITQSDAAEILGISKGQLCHILKGERALNEIIQYRMRDMTKGKRPDNKGGIYGIYYDDKIIYIGQTVNFKNRWSGHKSSIRTQKQDFQPFHNAQIDINKLTFKILFDKNKIAIFPSELDKIESFFITSVLPEWNTNIPILSHYHNSLNEKLESLVVKHNSGNRYLYNYLKPLLDIGLTTDGNEELIKTLDYSKEEIFNRSVRILQNSKQYKDNPSELNLRFEDINFENKE